MATSTTTISETLVELSHWDQHRLSISRQTELYSEHSRRASDVGEENVVIQQLSPADGGPAAWRLLIAAFVFEALLWGL